MTKIYAFSGNYEPDEENVFLVIIMQRQVKLSRYKILKFCSEICKIKLMFLECK